MADLTRRKEPNIENFCNKISSSSDLYNNDPPQVGLKTDFSAPL